MIQLEKVSVTYPGGVEALRGVDLLVDEGEFVVIVGLSGAGKSTLLRVLNGLVPATSGSVVVDGTEVVGASAATLRQVRSQIGMIFQTFNLLSRTSVWENVEAPMLYSGVSKADRASRIQEALEVVGIPEIAKALPNQLSGGQQQRVAAARALVNRPAILLADEPTGNLDSATSEEIMGFLQRLNSEQQITLVMVTHEQEVADYASRQIHMRDGQILRDEKT